MLRSWPFLLGLLWTAAVASGVRTMWVYETTPGGAGEPPARWPAASGIARAPAVATLVMLAHPRCPCTQASVEELSRLMARRRGRLRAHVLFYQPASRPDAWAETSLWREAAAIPGVSVRRDRGGAEARLFSAETSGHVVLYGADGRRLFSGGITGLRGHAGDNAGSRAVAALLAPGASGEAAAPVLGCSLLTAGMEVHGRALAN